MGRSARSGVWALGALVLLGACSGSPRYVAGGHTRPAQPPAARRSDRAESGRWQEVYRDLLGLPYRYGGTTRRGFDCSGLVQYAYRTFDGTRLPRTVEAQYTVGQPVDAAGLEVGDLVFYRTRGRRPSHVGIYVGRDRFLHASTSAGVVLSDLDESYYRSRFLGARRLHP